MRRPELANVVEAELENVASSQVVKHDVVFLDTLDEPLVVDQMEGCRIGELTLRDRPQPQALAQTFAELSSVHRRMGLGPSGSPR